MINDSKAGLGSRSEFPSKLLVVDMPGRFDEQEGGGWLQSIGSFVEEWARCRHFVNYGKGEQEIDDPLQSVKPHRVWRNHARIDTIEQPGFAGAAPQAGDHSRFDIDSNNAAGWADQASQFQCKEVHSGAGFEHDHAEMDVGRDDSDWILHETPQRTCEKVPDPPGTNVVTSHTNSGQTIR
jgi:hypothetical protein